MKVKTYFSTIAFLIFFAPTEFLKNWLYIRVRLILVVAKNLKINHQLEAKILANEVGKYEKATVDKILLYACVKLCTRAQSSSWACETTGFHPDVLFVTRRYFFLTKVLWVTRKVTKRALTCYKIYSFLSDFDSFR